MFPRAKAVVAGNGQMPNDLQPAIRSHVVMAADLALERQPKRTDVQLATGGRSRRDHRDGRQELDVHVASSFEYAVDYADLAAAGSADAFCQPDQNAFGAPHVAEAIH